MAENFEIEKQKIKTRARILLSQPLKNIAEIVLQIPLEDQTRAVEIFWKFSRDNWGIFQQESGNIAAIFPAFLVALDGDLSEERIKYLAEFVLTEARAIRINAGKCPS